MLNLQKSLCVCAIASLAIFAVHPPTAHAFPAGYRVIRQRGTISKIHFFDPKNPNLGPGRGADWVEIDPEEPVQRPPGTIRKEKVVFWMTFPDSNKITASKRDQEPGTIKFSDLRVGQKIVFSGLVNGGHIQPSIYKVYVP